MELEKLTHNGIQQFLGEYVPSNYYQPDYGMIHNEAIYVKGYWVDDKLAGIAGIYKKYGMVGNFTIIKKEYQGKGIGSQAIRDMIKWERKNNINFVIAQYRENTLEKMKKANGFRAFTHIGIWSYAILPFSWWSHLLIPVFPLLAILFHNIKHKGDL